jgi:glycosyltransferase involved in cell wall biosynthesis
VRTRIAHVRSSHDGYEATTWRRAYRRVMRDLIDLNATHVVAVSASAMQAFWGDGWEADDRRVVIYNGVEERPRASVAEREAARREIGLGPRTRMVLHVGAFAPAKNHEALVTVAAELERRGADGVLVLVGSGPLKPAIERAVAEHGLTARVRFLGARDDVPRWLRAADVLVHPSRWEGLPGAVLEALGAGLPVVASPIPPVLEIANQAAGVTVADPEDASSFADAIETALAGAENGAAVAAPLPTVFRSATSTERLLACYR